MSIAAAIDDLNESIFLPAIQREFVWTPDQIIRLFDSILREYPIGAFLIWRVKDEVAEDQIKYKFIRNYIEDSVYPDESDFKYVNHHNPKVPKHEALPGVQHLVLDGQQRLTAFYIGLEGTFTEKRKFASRKYSSAWSEKQLYLNLFSDPEEELEDELGLRYEFAFKSEQPKPSENAYWFRVGDILDVESVAEAMQLTEELGIDEFPKDQRYDAQQNLSTLFNAVTDDTLVQYHEETTAKHERVLDIFIRTNDGGTPLGKSEILLSMATAKWSEEPEGESGLPSIDAREKITDFVDDLNNRHPKRNFRFGIDFVLKSLLVLSDLNPEYRIANFTNENLAVMQRVWMEDDYQESVKAAIDLVVEFGLDKRSLTSHNALIPIAYFINYHDPSFDWDSTTGAENRQGIHYWLTSSLLNGTFNSRPDEVLADAREAIQHSEGTFPYKEIHRRMRGRGKVVGFSEDVVDSLLEETTYRSQKSFLLLSLLYYPAPVRQGKEYARDHIFPKATLEADNLYEEYGFNRAVAEQFENHRDSIANLQLVTGGENARKSDEPFEEWLDSRTDDYYDRHLIPREERLHKLENFMEFLSEREKRIREHIHETFSEFE
jgi:hypothetical protein